MPDHDERLDWYEAGLDHGIALGLQIAEDEARYAVTQAQAVARLTAARETFESLSIARGEPDRAARQRAIIEERGI